MNASGRIAAVAVVVFACGHGTVSTRTETVLILLVTREDGELHLDEN